MLRRNPRTNDILFICNNCNDKLETDTDQFPDALVTLKQEGWLATKDGQGNWVHYCDCCREDYE